MTNHRKCELRIQDREDELRSGRSLAPRFVPIKFNGRLNSNEQIRAAILLRENWGIHRIRDEYRLSVLSGFIRVRGEK